jgi:sugar phosphate isomerase/epimerase
VCFDTNHLLSEDLCEFIEKVGDKIVSTHISDYDFVNERHWLPGEGKIDWQKLINELKKVNYNEMWLYELNMGFLNTINRSRELTLDDVVKNRNSRRDPSIWIL